MPPDPILDTLTQASKDLLYPSDSDEPFTPFHWPAGPADPRAALTANAPPPPGAKIEQLSLEAFFADLTEDPRFAALQKTLQSTLTTPTVLRIGERRILIYLLGQLPDHSWPGLKTLSIET
ncbi:MAG TPA: nuclease A inhibitor family protein [Phycisphaerae bacterium]|nr:nuclease A inhibitor family protein [Phycisphaerae bacterium]